MSKRRPRSCSRYGAKPVSFRFGSLSHKDKSTRCWWRTIMETHNLPISLFALVVGLLISCKIGHAQDFSSFIARITKAEGHYEYNEDGVPVLGLITAVLSPTRVKFTFCSNKTMEVDRKQLKSSPSESKESLMISGPPSFR